MEASTLRELLAPFIPSDELDETLLASIRVHLDLLIRWNQHMNLTALRTPEEMVLRHFGESLFAARELFPREAQQEALRSRQWRRLSRPAHEVLGAQSPTHAHRKPRQESDLPSRGRTRSEPHRPHRPQRPRRIALPQSAPAWSPCGPSKSSTTRSSPPAAWSPPPDASPSSSAKLSATAPYPSYPQAKAPPSASALFRAAHPAHLEAAA